MPGPVLHEGAVVQCAHGGRAAPPSSYPRVLVGGLPVCVQQVPHLVAGCPLPPPPAANGPCVTAPWTTGSLRVSVGGGLPLVLFDSRATAVPSGAPLLVVSSQQRVVAT
ncbi:hypothetical protein ACFVVX_25385 [Kitasatospora sp. NPDC058170]|uniref:hypothetical protein n=1 Tax=Kitasatospora sp. NPDC058170 TaxID=3346364 RepID=UPI0036D802BE